MRTFGTRFEFGMKLAAEHKWMVAQFRDFDEIAVGRLSAVYHARVAQQVAVLIVEFKTMAVAFVDLVGVVRRVRFGALLQDARIRAQPHRAAQFGDAALFIHQINNGIFRAGMKFGGIGFVAFERAAREFDAHDLHAET